jgi:hypothetical protein
MLGLIAFALVSPLGALSRPECGMSCCRLAAARHASCASATTCRLTNCGQRGMAAALPSLPVSTLAAPPRLAAPTAAGSLASLPPPIGSSLPQAFPERPPRA